jgi:hypothetical protein
VIYVIDIDGTICNTSDGMYNSSHPYPTRIDYVNKLYDEGHTIIYWTARGGNSGLDWSDLTKQQLDSWGCKYHELRMKKPVYDVWVDDKAINDKAFFPV